jgi:hypothetical protein
MKILTAVLACYTVLMLGIHLTSWKLMGEWFGSKESWVKGWLPVMRVLRVEAFYWLLALATWSLWASVGKALVALFATIHIALWASVEWSRMQGRIRLGEGAPSRRLALTVTLFDFVEAFALIWVGYSAAAYLFRG